MKSRQFALVCAAALLFLVIGCESEPKPEERSNEAQKAQNATLFQDPLEPVLTELPAEALAYWRRADKQPSPLVLFSIHPFLNTIPESLRERAMDLAAAGSPEQLRRHGSINHVDPVILSQQVLTAAINAGLIERVIWIFPFKEALEQLDLQHFREQIAQTEFLSAEETAALTMSGGTISGTVRGIPLAILHPEAALIADEELFVMARPPIIHLDLSYFQGLFINSVSTPAYKSLLDTASMLNAMAWKPLSVTVSPRTEEGDIALEARFLAHDLILLAKHPDILSQQLPKIWADRTEALRLRSLLQMDNSRELFTLNAVQAPNDASVLYDLYNLKMDDNQVSEALDLLDRIVAIEPGYAFGYLKAATYFANNQQLDLSRDLLLKARVHYPNNPFILFSLAHLHTNLNEQGRADEIIQQLLTQPWSRVYHEQAIPSLQAMSKAG